MAPTLSTNDFHGKRTGPVVVVVMDGVGLGRDYPGNAVKAARKPVLDQLMASCPWTELAAHGTAVGMPSDADMGNSEVGHNAVGAGRVFDQGAKLWPRPSRVARFKPARAGTKWSATASPMPRAFISSACSLTATSTVISTT